MERWYLGLVIKSLFLALALGCAGSKPAPVQSKTPRPPETYIVATGDTLAGIAWRYGLDYTQVARWNGLASPDRIYPGQRLRLNPSGPRHAKVSSRATSTTRATRTSKPEKRSKRYTENTTSRRGRIANSDWVWPTQGQLVSEYNPKMPGGKGIEIGGRLGQPVKAASPGKVVYSGSGLPGYGRLVIVQHSGSLLSAYGYLGKILVEEGDRVQRGQAIAELGSNNENRPVLHFEIRQNGKPINPMRYIRS
jgi:lipoprotein NlpD